VQNKNGVNGAILRDLFFFYWYRELDYGGSAGKKYIDVMALGDRCAVRAGPPARSAQLRTLQLAAQSRNVYRIDEGPLCGKYPTERTA